MGVADAHRHCVREASKWRAPSREQESNAGRSGPEAICGSDLAELTHVERTCSYTDSETLAKLAPRIDLMQLNESRVKGLTAFDNLEMTTSTITLL